MIAAANILVIDDTPENVAVLLETLTQQGYDVRPATDAEFALESARSAPPDLILLDVKMPGIDGYEACKRLRADERTRDIPVIFISALGDVEDKVKGFEAGGVDYLTKPFQIAEVLARVRIHLLLQRLRNHLEELVEERTIKLQQALSEIQRLQEQLHAENIYLREEIRLEHNFKELIGQSQALRSLLSKVALVASTDAPVLITGETGTGKELIARAIHFASPRKDRPFVKVNCAALPAQLIESELFGHEKGAFTGAIAKQMGRFELANGGTIFLDEIGELPLELQPKLLRVLQDGQFEHIGHPRTIKVDVRVIAATNRNVTAEIQAGRFRQDLYYRLNVYPLTVPPLRERLDDIPLLARFFVQQLNKKLGKCVETIPQSAMLSLQQYAWPGNIRELENIIERAMITTPDTVLRVELPENPITTHETLPTLEEHERAYILRILHTTHGRIHGSKGAAAILGMNPWTLRSRMEKLGIKKSSD